MKRIHFGLAHTFRTPEAVQRYIQQYNGTEGMVASVVMMITANAISYYKDHELALIMDENYQYRKDVKASYRREQQQLKKFLAEELPLRSNIRTKITRVFKK